MIRTIDNPFTLRHILWHWVLGVVMTIDGLIAVLSLGLLHSWFTPGWIESAVGDRLHSHKIHMPEMILEEEIIKAMVTALTEPSIAHGVQPTKAQRTEEWN